MLAELFGETAEETLPGLEDLGLVVGEPLLDIIHAFDHDAPVKFGEFAGGGDDGHGSPAGGAQAPRWARSAGSSAPSIIPSWKRDRVSNPGHGVVMLLEIRARGRRNSFILVKEVCGSPALWKRGL